MLAAIYNLGPQLASPALVLRHFLSLLCKADLNLLRCMLVAVLARGLNAH